MTPDQLIHLNVWMPKSTVVVLLTFICVCVSFTLDSLYFWIKTKVIKSNNDVIRTYPCIVDEDNSSILKVVSMMQEIQQQQEDILKSQLSISSRQELLSENIIQQKLLTKLLFKVINTVVVHGNVHQCNKVLKLLSISGLSQDTINEIDPIE
jgi:hypothetical protein